MLSTREPFIPETTNEVPTRMKWRRIGFRYYSGHDPTMSLCLSLSYFSFCSHSLLVKTVIAVRVATPSLFHEREKAY